MILTVKNLYKYESMRVFSIIKKICKIGQIFLGRMFASHSEAPLIPEMGHHRAQGTQPARFFHYFKIQDYFKN